MRLETEALECLEYDFQEAQQCVTEYADINYRREFVCHHNSYLAFRFLYRKGHDYLDWSSGYYVCNSTGNLPKYSATVGSVPLFSTDALSAKQIISSSMIRAIIRTISCRPTDLAEPTSLLIRRSYRGTDSCPATNPYLQTSRKSWTESRLALSRGRSQTNSHGQAVLTSAIALTG